MRLRAEDRSRCTHPPELDGLRGNREPRRLGHHLCGGARWMASVGILSQTRAADRRARGSESIARDLPEEIDREEEPAPLVAICLFDMRKAASRSVMVSTLGIRAGDGVDRQGLHFEKNGDRQTDGDRSELRVQRSGTREIAEGPARPGRGRPTRRLGGREAATLRRERDRWGTAGLERRDCSSLRIACSRPAVRSP